MVEEELLNLIESTRNKLTQLTKVRGMDDPEVRAVSMELDDLINKYNHMAK